MTDRHLIIGLGNPGPEYENTRHNVGFRCVESLATKYGLSWNKKKQSKAKIADGSIAGHRVILVKPQTYMNLSGSSVQGLSLFYKIPSDRILVIFDDMDIPLGTLRIRSKGGSGGHRGMADIVQKLGTQEIARIRFGIGRPPLRMDPAAYVLQPFRGDDVRLVNAATDAASAAIEAWITDGINYAMNQFNGTVTDPISHNSETSVSENSNE